MATSGSKSVAVTSYDTLKFSWERTSYSIANNTSTISWKLELIAKANGAIYSTASKAWSVTVDGTKKSGTNTVGISAGATKTLASGTKTITHNTDGSKSFSYSFSQEFGITFGGSSIGTKSGSGTGTLDTIPRQATLTTAPNFNDENNPTISYSNPAGSAVNALEACIKDNSGDTIYVDYRSVSKTGTSYTFELTDAERKTLRKAITKGNSLAVKFYLRTTIGETKYFSVSSKTLTLTNYTPTISATIKDTNATSKALTGDENKIIKYFNTVSIATGATARKEATIKSVKVTCGSKSISTASGTLTNVESGDFVITVTDSRGNTTTKTVKKTLVNYIKVSCNLTASAEMGSNNTATLKLSIKGDYFNGSFGTSNNTLTVQYRYKTNSGSYGSWTTVTATKSGNKYTATKNITGLNYQNSYTVQARAIDAVNTSGKTSGAVTVKAQPVFDWSKDDFAFNVPVYIGGVAHTGANKVLWGSGRTTGYYMGNGQTVTLSEGISKQANGIVLVFCHYASDEDTNRNYQYHFVPKSVIALTYGKTHVFPLSSLTFATVGSKVLIFDNDTTIKGSAGNVNTGTGTSGISYTNNKFVLRYVIGV